MSSARNGRSDNLGFTLNLLCDWHDMPDLERATDEDPPALNRLVNIHLGGNIVDAVDTPMTPEPLSPDGASTSSISRQEMRSLRRGDVRSEFSPVLPTDGRHPVVFIPKPPPSAELDSDHLPEIAKELTGGIAKTAEGPQRDREYRWGRTNDEQHIAPYLRLGTEQGAMFRKHCNNPEQFEFLRAVARFRTIEDDTVRENTAKEIFKQYVGNGKAGLPEHLCKTLASAYGPSPRRFDEATAEIAAGLRRELDQFLATTAHPPGLFSRMARTLKPIKKGQQGSTEQAELGSPKSPTKPGKMRSLRNMTMGLTLPKIRTAKSRDNKATPVDGKEAPKKLNLEVLNEIRHDKSRYDKFMSHLQTEYSTENMFFVDQVEHFRNTHALRTPQSRDLLGRSIVEEFIRTNAAQQVNLPNEIRHGLEEIYQNGDFQDPDVFAKAEAEINRLMSADSLPRFMTSKFAGGEA